jgi:hypothetical protein
MKDMEEKMSAFSAEPADEKTIPNKKFSKQPIVVKGHNEARYNKLLAKVTKK